MISRNISRKGAVQLSDYKVMAGNWWGTLFTQKNLVEAIEKAERRIQQEKKEKEKAKKLV